MAKELTRSEIRDALKSSDECFLCALERVLEQEYVEHYLCECVMDPASRAEVVASRGFCNHHSHIMLAEVAKPKTADGLGVALVVKSVAEAFVEDIEAQGRWADCLAEPEARSLSRIVTLARDIGSLFSRLKGEKRSIIKEKVQRWASLRKHCPACRSVDFFVKLYADELVDALDGEDHGIVELFKASRGMCVPHYSTVICSLDERLPGSRKGPVARQIVEVQLKNMRRLNLELSEFIRKHDYRFSNEPWGTEQDVVPRAVMKLSGKRGVKTMLEREEQEVRSSIEDHHAVPDNRPTADRVGARCLRAGAQ